MSQDARSPSARWQPWVDFKDRPQGPIPVYSPPCPTCKFWRPVIQRKETPYGDFFDGVTCCHNEDMFGDFSCFKPRETT